MVPLWLSSVIVAAANYVILLPPTVSSFHRFPASSLLHHHSSSASSTISNAPRRATHSIAFVDNGGGDNELDDIITTLHEGFATTTKRGTAAGMSSSKDVEAYHDMVSAAVDFSSIYVRNGIVTGK